MNVTVVPVNAPAAYVEHLEGQVAGLIAQVEALKADLNIARDKVEEARLEAQQWRDQYQQAMSALTVEAQGVGISLPRVGLTSL